MAGKGKATTITPPMIQAAARGLNTITGADQAWMSPGNPLPAMVPSATGRQYDYATAVNLNITPRSEEGISFGDLRALADAYYLVRLAIETRKDQLEKLRWVVKPTDDKVKPDQRCKDLTLFFKKPDQRHGWREWLRMIVEDVLVIDAPAVYYHENMGDKPYAFEIIDGATIKVLLDQYGRQPVAPDPAYQQNIKGIPTVNYTTKELVYKPRNPRSWKAYGLSPVEQIVTIVNIGLRRELSQLQFYTEGNIPEAIAGTPETWNPDQIAAYQKYWDSLLEGNTGNRRHMKFVPGGMDIHETKSATLTDAFDEWLARVVQYCFSLPATAYVKQVNKGETTNMKEQAEEEGLAPIMLWVEDFVNHLISTYWGYDDIHFAWEDEKSIDPLVQAQIDQIYITTDVVEKNEVRASLGLEARDYDAEAEKKLKAAQAAMPPAPMDVSTGQLNNKPVNGNAPQPASKKDGAITNKHDHSADVKKKTYAALSPSNLKKAAKIASAFKKGFKKNRPQIISQITKAYESAAKSYDTDDLRKSAGDDITGKLDLDFSMVLTVTAKNLNAAAREGADRGADLISMQYDGELDIDTKKIAEGVGDYNAAELVTNIDETTRDMLAGDIDDAFKEGWSSATLANKLEENYAFSDSRAETIARTEIARADQEGSMKAYRASGVVHNKAWLLAEEPCAICEENENDGIIGIDELFSSGDDAAPAHPNCECTVTPIVGEAEDDNESEED